MCSGRIDPQFVLDAFARGADGVLIGGCHPGDCHYMEGNTKALRRVRALQRLLRDMGVHEDRFRLEWISASEGEKVKTVINDMVERIRVLGPLSLPAHCAQWDAEVGSLERAIAAEQKQADGDAGVQIPSSPPAAVGADQTQESSSLPQHHSGAKPKIALYWCASCGGCEESVVDLAEGIIGLLATIDIVFWPVAMDFKKSDVEKLGDGEIFASLIKWSGPHVGAGGDGTPSQAEKQNCPRIRLLRTSRRDTRSGKPVQPGRYPPIRVRRIPVDCQRGENPPARDDPA